MVNERKKDYEFLILKLKNSKYRHILRLTRDLYVGGKRYTYERESNPKESMLTNKYRLTFTCIVSKN